MTPAQLLEKATTQTIGNKPVVVLPLKDWQKIQIALEDFEMIQSKNYKKNIEKSRKDKKLYEFNPAKNAFKKLKKK